MSASNTGFAKCRHCGAEYRLFTIFNKDMQGLCKAWKNRHERSCKVKTPRQRRQWAKKYAQNDDSSITINLFHTGLQDV